jgi:iron complex transport system substrate-binding protein
MRLSPFLAALAALCILAAEALAAGPPYRRVVSLYAAHAENLALMGARGALVGVSEPMDGLPVVSARDGAEAIAALGPDLVLARPMHRLTQPGLMEQLERLGVAVACLQPVSMAELAPYWIELGRLAGREDAAREMAARFTSGLAALKAKAAAIPEGRRKRVFFEAIHRQMKTVSPDSMAAFVLETAGVANLAKDARPVSGTNIADFGLERVVALGDMIDVYLAQTGPMNPVSAEEIAATPGLSSLRAVREGRVRLVDEAIASRPTPRLLEGVRAVAAACYPEDQSAGDIP